MIGEVSLVPERRTLFVCLNSVVCRFLLRPIRFHLEFLRHVPLSKQERSVDVMCVSSSFFQDLIFLKLDVHIHNIQPCPSLSLSDEGEKKEQTLPRKKSTAVDRCDRIDETQPD